MNGRNTICSIVDKKLIEILWCCHIGTENNWFRLYHMSPTCLTTGIEHSAVELWLYS